MNLSGFNEMTFSDERDFSQMILNIALQNFDLSWEKVAKATYLLKCAAQALTSWNVPLNLIEILY